MPRTPEEIWTDLNRNISEASALQTELNEAIAIPPSPPDGGLPLYPEPIIPAEGYPKEPPNSAERRVPEDYSNIAAAMTAASDGDTISCADGFRTGTVVVDKPIILKSRNKLKAIMDGRLTIRTAGAWIHGFKSTFLVPNKGDGSIIVNADNTNITCMEIQSPHGITSIASLKRKNINIGWCLFNGINKTTESVSNIFFKVPEGGLTSNYSDLPNHIHIYRCDFHDDGARPSDTSMEDHCIYFGDSKPKGDDKLTMEDVILYQNLIRQSNKRVRGFYMKRGCIMMQNSLLGCKYNWGIRHGGEALILSNHSVGSSMKLIINGPRTKVYNNNWSNAELYAGSAKNSQGDGPYYQAADYTDLDQNIGPMLIGNVCKVLNSGQGGEVNHVMVHRHEGNITVNDTGCDRMTYTKDEIGKYSYPPRIELTTADVGPLA